ncbi:hypothetical protein GCM10023263_39070 [Phytohabitans rumicis]
MPWRVSGSRRGRLAWRNASSHRQVPGCRTNRGRRNPEPRAHHPARPTPTPIKDFHVDQGHMVAEKRSNHDHMPLIDEERGRGEGEEGEERRRRGEGEG